MTNFKISILSWVASFLFCWIQFIHAVPTPEFTSYDAAFVFAQNGLNQSLIPPKDHKAIGQLYATGFQHYTYNGTLWVLMNASAELYNARFENIGTHYYLTQKDALGGQPTWEAADLSSLVTCKPIFIQPVENAITWVLLQTTNSSGNADLFGKVTYVQRLYTQKGLPPSFPAGEINATYDSPYNAFYVYYKKI